MSINGGKLIPLFVLTVALQGQTIVSTRILSGSGSDRAGLVAVDRQGFVYIAGTTTSGDFPVTHALQPVPQQAALRFSAGRVNFTAATLPASRVSSVSASADGKTVLAATLGGVYRSSDGGATWSLANTGLPSSGLAIAVDPSTPNRACVIVASGAIFRTADGGSSWKASDISITAIAPGNAIQFAGLAVNPQSPATFYALTNTPARLFRSNDSGASWQPISIPDSEEITDGNGVPLLSTFALAPSAPNTLYSAGGRFLHKSTDGGITWTRMAQISAHFAGSLAVDPGQADVVWVVNSNGVSRSVDGGASFEPAGLTGNAQLHVIAVDVSVASGVPSRVFAADYHNVYESADNGATWQRVAGGTIETFYVSPSGVYLAGDVGATAFLAKLDPTLTQVVYSTYFGPATIDFDGLAAIAVASDGSVYLTGTTESPDFPTTGNALQRTFSSGAAGFVSKVSRDGASLLYSTLLDGVLPNSIAVDSDGNAVIAGTANAGKLPVTAGAIQSAPPGPCLRQPDSFGYKPFIATHAFVAKLNADASALLYSTYLTGACGDVAYAVALDAAGAAYVTGETYADDFPVTSGASAAKVPGLITSGFVAKLSAPGDRLEYSSLFGGGNFTAGRAMALGGSGEVYIGGNTQAKSTPGAFQRPPTNKGCPGALGFVGTGNPTPSTDSADAFAMKLNLTAADPVFLATFGSACADSAYSMALDSTGGIWLAGIGRAVEFSTRAPIGGLGGLDSGSAFLARLAPDGSDLTFAAFTGGGGVATGSGSDVFFAGGLIDPQKTLPPNVGALDSVEVARLDGSAVAPIALDRIVSFNGSNSSYDPSAPLPIAPAQMIRLEGRGIGPATQAGARLTGDGRLDTSIGGVTVTFDGVPAPMVTAQANEIVLLAPFALDGKTVASVQVQFNGQKSNLYPTKVAAQYADTIAVANADGTLNSPNNPAMLGSIFAVYVTGLGQTSPPGIDGSVTRDSGVRLAATPGIYSGSFPQFPVFIGPAPGEVAGISQVNLVAVDPGAFASLPISIGGAFATVFISKPK
jgi:uncharacterized protein (TIGR03437 family)